MENGVCRGEGAQTESKRRTLHKIVNIPVSETKNERTLSWLGAPALFGLGSFMVLAGVFANLTTPGRITLWVLGLGATMFAAVLSRIEGPVELTPRGIKFTVAKVLEYVELVHLKAQNSIPDKAKEATGLAFSELAPLISKDAIRRRLFRNSVYTTNYDALLERALAAVRQSPEDFAERIINQVSASGSAHSSGEARAE